MKRFLLLVAVLAFALPCAAQDEVVTFFKAAATLPATFCASATNTTSGLTGVFCGDLQGNVACNTGDAEVCRAGWTGTTTGTPDFDYSGPNAIAGNSLALSSCANSEDQGDGRTFTEGTTAEFYWYFAQNIVTAPSLNTASADIFEVRTSNCGSAWGNVYVYNSAGTLYFRAKLDGAAVNSGASITTGIYHFWLHTVRGSGADAALYLMFNTSATRPTDWTTCGPGGAGHNNCIRIEGGTSTGYPDCVRPVANYTSATNCVDTVVDNLFVSSTEIGDNP